MIVKGGLFDGIGGFDLPADWLGWHTAFHCEIDPFCATILKHHWPHAKNLNDITTADFTEFQGKIDVLTGGFPCQPFSNAGKQKGTNDYRYLWPQMCQAIDTIRPAWVVGENVTGILSMEDQSQVWKDVFFRVDYRNTARLQKVDQYEAIYVRQGKMLLDSICQDLEKIGYSVQPFVIPAAAKEAPHRRDRVWIIAHRVQGDVPNSNSPGRKGNTEFSKGYQSDPNRVPQHIIDPLYDNGVTTNTCSKRLERRKIKRNTKDRKRKRGSKEQCPRSDKRHIWSNWKNFPTQPPICGGNDGLPSQLDGISFPKWRKESIKAYGNAVVPQVVHEIYKAIEKEILTNV